MPEREDAALGTGVSHCTECGHEYTLTDGRAPKPTGDRLWLTRTTHQILGLVLGLGVGYIAF